jgi:hypothetical protein
MTRDERLKGIVSFLPDFQNGKGLDRLDGFVQAAYQYEWVSSEVNWGEWKQTPEAEKLRDEPDVLSQASEHDLVCLLTTCIRQERFCEGALESTYESGLLTGILQRADALLNENSGNQYLN